MKKTLHQKLRGIVMLALFLTATVSWGQVTFSITRGSNGESSTNATGITVTTNIPSSCSTSANGSTLLYTQYAPLAGFTATITGVSGSASRSSAGYNQVNWQLVNGSSTVNGTTVCGAQSSSCGASSGSAFTVPTISTSQTIASGGNAKVNVVRAICTNGNTPSGGGYTAVNVLTVTGTITGIGNITNSSNATITSLSFPNTNVAATSAASSFVLQPSAISGSNIKVQAPTNWVVCETSNGTYTSSISFANNTATKTIYIKFAPTTSGALSGQVVVSKETNGASVTNRTLNVSGTGVAVPPPAVTSTLTDTSVYGSTDSYQITASNTPNGYNATYNGGALPAGMVLTAASGLITIDESLAAGTYNIAISASNAGGGFGTAQTLVYTRTAKPLTLTGGDADDKIYDGTTDVTITAAPTLSGILDGDTVNITGSPVAAFVSADAGTQQIRITGGYDVDNTNYTLVYPQEPAGLTAVIFQKELTITGIFINDKNFDGNTVASIGGTPSLLGIIDGDTVTVNGSASEATFTSTGPSTNIPVIVSGYTLEGADAANYTVVQPTGLTGNINDTGLQFQTITFDPLSAVTYGDASFTLNASSTSGLEITYTSSDDSIATVSGNTVTVTGAGTVTITASQPGNGQYNPAQAVQQELVVNPKTLTINDAAAITKTYDGTNAAQVSGTLTGIVGTDIVTPNGTGTFDNENAGVNKVVTTAFTLSGADADNYVLQQPGDVTGTITPLQLTVSNAAAQDKVYDGNNVAAITGTLDGVVGTDVVTLVGAGTFVSTGVAQDIEVTAAVTLDGDDAANYTVAQPAGLSADITPAGITVIATASDKVYDRTIDAQITVTGINGAADGDDVTVTGGGTFDNYNVATGKPVTASLVLAGADAANYTLTQPTGLTASITKKDITADITAAIVADKVYNNTTAAVVSGVVLNDVVTGDEADVQVVSAVFEQETVGTGIPVSDFVLSGTASGNYNLVQPVETLSGNITPATLTLNSAIAQNKVYDGTDAAAITGTLAGIVTGDTVTYIGTGTFASPDVANGITVTAAITLGGADAANYIITQPTGLTANITRKAVTVAAEAVSKVYDGNIATIVQNAYVVTTDIISPDDVTLAETTVSGTFNNPTVANNKPVSAVFILAGADAANYSITVQTYPANITAATLTVDVTNAAVTTKTYDGTAVAQVTGAVLNGVLDGDTVNAVSGTFDSANAGSEKPVTIVLTGTGAANYTLTQPETLLTGTVNKKDITATANNLSKVQGTANPALTITYNGLVNGETAATAFNFVAPATATTAVTSSPIGVYPITIQGGSAANYNFTSLTGGWLNVMATTTAANILAWDFTGEAQLATSTAEIQNSNLDSSLTLSRGAGAPASAGANSFRTTSFQNNGVALTNTDYFQFEISADPNYVASLSSIDASFRGTATFGVSVTHRYAYSTDGTNFTFIGNPVVTTTGEYATLSVDVSGVAALQNIPAGTTVTFRYYASGNTTTGGWGFYSASTGSYGLAIKGIVAAAPILPAITSALTDSSSIGATDTYQITAIGTPQMNLSATSLPAGATVDNTGLITFDGTTPVGTYNIALSATNFYGSDAETLVYTINKLNQVLTFDPDPLPVKVIGEAPFLFEVSNTAGLPVNWSSSDESVVTIDAAGVITIVGPGTATITASNAGNEIYNPVTETRTITVSSGCFEWTGAVSTNWTEAGNWCGNIVPFSTSDVTIADAANDPIITSGIANVHNLTVAAGANLTVNPGATLNVDNILNVNAAGTLTIQNNAALLQGDATVTNANSGTITVNKNSNPLYRLDYTLWSSPVSNWTLGQFSPATAATRFYEYKYDTNGTAYVEAYWPLASSTQFDAAKGYLIRMPNVLSNNVTGTTNDGVTTPAEYIAGTDNYIYNGTFTGAPHNGTITYPLSVEGDLYTAVGNPYPSPINITDFFFGDTDPNTAGIQNNGDVMDVASGIYFWRKRNNSANSSYATINLGGYVQNPAEGGGSEQAAFYSGDSQNWTLAQGQGFLVKTKNGVANPQLTFTNSMRTPSTGASQGFFKSAPSTASRLWLNMAGENNTASQTMVGYFEDATLDLDYGFDAKKFTDGNAVAFYSLANETALAIQARPGFETSDVVPMGFVVPNAGTFTVSLDHVDGLFAGGQKIYLRDNAEGIVRDLTQYDYTFTTEAGTFEGRFDVIYTTQALGTDNPVADANKVIVYTEGKVIGINSGNTMMNNVNIFDIRGRKLYSQNNINNTELKISNLTAEQQVLIVEVDTVNGKVSKRIVF